MAQQLQGLAIDFASFNNLSDQEGVERFISALSGSSEVLDKFGINIKAAALDQQFLRMGLSVTTAKATEQQKVMARLAIITEAMGSQGAIGDAIKTSGSFANQLKRLKSQVKDTAAELGKALLPVLGPMLKSLNRAVTAVAEWIKENPGLAQSIAKVAVAVGIAGVALLGLGAAAFVLSAIASAAAMIVSPVGLAAAAVVALVVALKQFNILDKISGMFGQLGNRAGEVIDGIKQALMSGDVTTAAKIFWLGLKREFLIGSRFLRQPGQFFKEKSSSFVAGLAQFGVNLGAGAARLFGADPGRVNRAHREASDFLGEKLGRVLKETENDPAVKAINQEIRELIAQIKSPAGGPGGPFGKGGGFGPGGPSGAIAAGARAAGAQRGRGPGNRCGNPRHLRGAPKPRPVPRGHHGQEHHQDQGPSGQGQQGPEGH